MPADDLPLDALEHQLKMEELSVSPVTKLILNIASFLPVWPFDKISSKLKDRLAADSAHKVRILIETIEAALRRQADAITRLDARLSEQERQKRYETATDLLVDATRKTLSTRAVERVTRIGLILANGITEPQTDPDEVEEMMRIAMDLSDKEIGYLRALVGLEGQTVASLGRVARYDAHNKWAEGPWGTQPNPEIDSVFSKLASYGLVAPLPPPNNLNTLTDFQNRYVLLPKGLRFSQLIQDAAK